MLIRKYWKWLLSLVLLAGVVAGGLVALCALNANAADDYIDGSAWVDSVSAQRLPDGKIASDKYVDIAPDEHVSAYDGVRFKATFTVPKGTLSADNNKVRFSITGIDFKKSGYPQAGKIWNGSVEYGTLTFDGEANPGSSVSGNYAIITFNSNAINDNAVTDLTAGTFQFNVNPAKALRGSNKHTVSIGDGSFPLYIDRAHLTVVKEATGTPSRIDYSNAYEFNWIVKVKNDSSIPVKYARVLDCRAKNDSARCNEGTKPVWLQNIVMDTDNNRVLSNFDQTINAGETKTYMVSSEISSVEYADNIKTIYNYFSVYVDADYATSSYYSDVDMHGATFTGNRFAVFEDWASQDNPFYRQLPNVSVKKARDDHDIEYVNRNTGATCKHGDEGCTAKVGWTITVTNNGDGDAKGVSLIEQGIGTYWTDAQIIEIENAIKDASGIESEWTTTNSDFDGATAGEVEFKSAIKGKQSFTFSYHNTANVGPNDSDIGKKNCASLSADGIILDENCRGLEFDIESLHKYSYSSPDSYSIASYDDSISSSIMWGIYTSLSSAHVGKTVIIHEKIQSGMTGARVQVIHDDTPSSSACQKDSYDVCYYQDMRDIPSMSSPWIDVNNSYSYDSNAANFVLHRTGTDSFDIIIPDAHSHDAIYINPIMDADYLNAHGESIQKGYYDSVSGDVKYECKSLTLTNTATSNIADTSEDANTWFYQHFSDAFPYTIIKDSFEKSATAEPATSVSCTNTQKIGGVSSSNVIMNGTTVLYYIEYNTAGFMLNGGKTTTLTDRLTNLPDNASVLLDKESVKQCHYNITDFNDTCDNSDTAKSIDFDWDSSTNTLTLKNIPDSKSITISYKLILNSSNDRISGLKNEVSADINAANTVKTTYAMNDVPISHSGGSVTGNMVFILKTDKNKYSSTPVLKDAVFSLEKWNGSSYTKVQDYTTNSDGTVGVGNLECGTAYRVTETKAPSGYKLSSIPQEFYLKGCGTDSGKRPSDFQGNALITASYLNFSDAAYKSTYISIHKVDADDNSLFLSGSEWELRKKDGTVVMKIIDNGENDSNAMEGYINFKVDETMIGDYNLVETKAPTGYNLYEGNDKGKIHVSVRLQQNSMGYEYMVVTGDDEQGLYDENTAAFIIPDSKAKQDIFTGFLPMTGRNAVFMVIAVTIMASVVAVLVMRKHD